MSIVLPSYIPDIWRGIGSFLGIRDLGALFRTGKSLNTLQSHVFDCLARAEQIRLKLSTFLGIQIKPNDVERQWRQLDVDTCKGLKIDLSKQPLIFYSGRLDSSTVLLNDDVLAARGNDQAMQKLVEEEDLLSKAVVLANSINDPGVKNVAIRHCALKKEIPLNIALEIADKMPIGEAKIQTLLELAMRNGLQLETIQKICQDIRNAEEMSMALNELANRQEVPSEIALRIARSIPEECQRIDALKNIAIRQQTVEDALKIAQEIFSYKCEYSKCLQQIALKDEVPLEKSLEIVNRIPNFGIKGQTLGKLAQSKCLSWETALDIANSINNDLVNVNLLAMFEKSIRT